MLGWEALSTARTDLADLSSVGLGLPSIVRMGLAGPGSDLLGWIRLGSVALDFAGLVLAGLDCGGPDIFRVRSTWMCLYWACLGCACLSWDWVGWVRLFLLYWTELG